MESMRIRRNGWRGVGAWLIVVGALAPSLVVAPAYAATPSVDLRVFYPKDATTTGAGVHSSDGSGQTKVFSIRKRTKEAFLIGCLNDGTSDDGIILTATTPPKGFKVTYTFYSGTVDITDDVTGKGFVLPTQAPSQSWGVAMYVRARPEAPRSGSWLITGTSTTDDSASDTIGMKVRLKR